MSISTADLSRHLDAGEKTLWSGGPPAGIMFRSSDLFMIPFSILWFGFALFWEAGVLGIGAGTPNSAPFFFPLFGLFFVCVGFYMAIGRFFWDAYVRGGTTYALTNKRAVILVRRPFSQVRSVELTGATKIETEERGDGAGSIYFGERMQTPRRSLPIDGATGDFMFERVPNVRSVVGVVRNIQSKAA